MKAILLFVAAGVVRESHRIAANNIARETGKRVVFRNASSAELSGEKPEPNEGVAGVIPTNYKTFPAYGEDGKLISGDAAPKPAAPPEAKLNTLGLPEGHPDDKDALKEALKGAGVDFHPNTGINKLVALYKEQNGLGESEE